MEYRRNLPHFQPDGAELFRLFGTLPLPSSRGSLSHDGPVLVRSNSRSALAKVRPSRVAQCVTDTILEGERGRALYALVAFVVMPNHVHILIDPQAPAPKITQFLKGVSARRANLLLRRTGQPFWQGESFDRWVRSSKERGNIIQYIEFNPVRANLASEPHLFRYSSAFHLHAETATG